MIGQVASFVQKLKASTIINKPEFQENELAYIHIDDEEKKAKKVRLKYENKFYLFCQFWSYIIYFMILWEASFELVMGKLEHGKVL